MGVDIALMMRCAGLTVTVAEPDAHVARRAADFLRQSQGGQIDVVSVACCDGMDLVLDAMGPGDETWRRDVYRSMAKSLPPDTTILTDGMFDIVADALRRTVGAHCVGFRLSQPCHIRQLVEISAPAETPELHVAAAFELAEALGKQAVRVPHGKASIGQRLAQRLSETAEILLMDGAIPHELDSALVDFGFDIGLFQAEDLVGLDVAYADRRRRDSRSPIRHRHMPIADRMVQEGRIGKMAGVGWYRYPGGGGAVIDPLVEDLTREEAWFAGIRQREIGAAELLETVLLAMIHEGALMLADGTARTAADIDLVSVAGLAFPADRIGVMAHADAKGMSWITERLGVLSRRNPVAWPDSRVISDCARAGKGFADWGRA